MGKISLKGMRRKTGKTIDQVAKKLGISPSWLQGLEEYRRVAPSEVIEQLASEYNRPVAAIQESFDINEQDVQALQHTLQQEGRLNGFHFYSKYRKLDKPFVWMINDFWQRIMQESRYMKYPTLQNAHPEDVLKEWRQLLIHEELVHTDRIPIVVTQRRSISLCWVEIYEPCQVQSGRFTVVLEGIKGMSPCNSIGEHVAAVFSQLLIPMNYIRSRERFLTGEDVRKLVRENKIDFNGLDLLIRYEEYGSNRYMITKVKDGYLVCVDHSGFSLVSETPSPYKRYRVLRNARDLANPFPDNDGDDRCSDRRGKCPLVTGKRPDTENGCTRCWGMAKSWELRTWLLQHMTDEEIEYTSYDEFVEKYPELNRELLEYTEEKKDYEAEILYGSIQNYGSYSGANMPIIYHDYENEENSYTDGRHRTKVAQILGIDIHIQLSTDRKLDAELVRDTR